MAVFDISGSANEVDYLQEQVAAGDSTEDMVLPLWNDLIEQEYESCYHFYWKDCGHDDEKAFSTCSWLRQRYLFFLLCSARTKTGAAAA